MFTSKKTSNQVAVTDEFASDFVVGVVDTRNDPGNPNVIETAWSIRTHGDVAIVSMTPVKRTCDIHEALEAHEALCDQVAEAVKSMNFDLSIKADIAGINAKSIIDSEMKDYVLPF